MRVNVLVHVCNSVCVHSRVVTVHGPVLGFDQFPANRIQEKVRAFSLSLSLLALSLSSRSLCCLSVVSVSLFPFSLSLNGVTKRQRVHTVQ
jgi:hypothetical protein